MDLENIGLDCPTYDVGDCSMTTFEIGEFYPIGANNGKLVIKQNNVVIGEFFADQSDETEVNIDLSAYATTADVEADIETAKGEMQELIDAKASIAELEEEANLREEEDTRLAGEINQLGTELNAEVNARTQADTTLTNALNAKATISALTAETTNRENADNELQSQIDAITSQSDVVDIVGTYAQLQAYDTSHLGNNDIIKVLTDSTHDNAPSYFRWNKTAGTWNYVGSESVAYTKAEADDRFVPKTRTINGKALSANVTLTTNDLTNDSGYLTESDLTDYVKNTDYATTSGAGIVKVSSTYAVAASPSNGNIYTTERTYAQYADANQGMFIGKATLENVLNGRKYLMPEYTLELPTTGEANKLYLTPATEQPDIEATATGKDIELADASEGDLIDWTIKGDTEQASYTGKNLLNYTGNNYSGNGVTITNNGGNTFTYNGALTAGFNYVLGNCSLKAGKTYTASLEVLGGSAVQYYVGYLFQILDNNNTSNFSAQIGTTKKSVQFTPTADATSLRFWHPYNANQTNESFSNFKFRLQIEEGNSATDFEPYVGGTSSPNPEYPQEVKTVTGRNTVSVVGKNIFRDDIVWRNKVAYRDEERGEPVSWTGYHGFVEYLSVEPNTTYTFSNAEGKRFYYGLVFYDNNKNFISVITSSTSTFTTPENCHYIRGALKIDTAPTNCQIEKGSVATTYQPYSGQEVEVNLGKNLVDANNATIYKCYLGSASIRMSDNGNSLLIPVNAGETYTISRQDATGTVPAIGFIDDIPREGLAWSDRHEFTSGELSYTAVAPSGYKYMLLYFAWSTESEATQREYLLQKQFQIERGDKATEYAPYFEPIELCKLGDYQDRIFKDGDTWKIEKKTAKIGVVQSTGVYKQAYGGNTYSITAPNMNQSTTNKNVYSEYFTPLSWEARTLNTQNSVYSRPNDGYSIEIRNTQWNTIEDFKSWAVDNLSFYYTLATPVVTEITYQPLIDQLNALETLATVKGYNHITTDTPSVQPFLEFGYFRPDPTVTKDEWLWVENHYEQLGGERRYTHNLSVNHNTAQGHWDYAFTIVGKEASHYTQLAQVAYYLFREHAGLHIPVSGTYTEGNDVYLLTKITASSLGQVTIEMRKLSDGSVRSISTGAVPVLDTIS